VEDYLGKESKMSGIVDKTGEPRDTKDILDAIKVCKGTFIRMQASPELLVILPTVIEGLNELLRLRQTKGE
jgi:hypothetical protein